MTYDLSQPPVSSDILLRAGPILIGALLSWALLGVSTVQLYIYHVASLRDRWIFVVSVYAIFALDVVQSILAIVIAWQTLCAGWGRPSSLRFPGSAFNDVPLVSSIISFWVQIFYAWRIYQLGRWKILPVVIIVTGLAQTAAAFAVTILFGLVEDIKLLHETRLVAVHSLWLGGSAFTDITIMLSMAYLLYNAKQQHVFFERSGRTMNRLIRLTVETGCACAICAVVELGLFLGKPNTNLHFVFAMVLSKVYSNSLMTSLNSRAHIGRHDSEPLSPSGVMIPPLSPYRTALRNDSDPHRCMSVHISKPLGTSESLSVDAPDTVGDTKAGQRGWDMIEMSDLTPPPVVHKDTTM
ncbi:hypothetical protein C8Q80DRAFT_1266436 [Daedaleopsis nitida]|nr:hypothetical protein C8Q80DRAFT_1266436 [Daedaleopsis nitida]